MKSIYSNSESNDNDEQLTHLNEIVESIPCSQQSIIEPMQVPYFDDETKHFNTLDYCGLETITNDLNSLLSS